MKYYLYQLEVIPKQAFYIGITHNPTQRMVAHLASRKRRTLKERFIDDMRQAGVPVQMKVLAIFDDKKAAKDIEWGMVSSMYGLFNGQGNMLMQGVHYFCTCEWTANMSLRKSDRGYSLQM